MSVFSRARTLCAAIAVSVLTVGLVVAVPSTAQAGNGSGQVLTNETAYGPNETIYASGAAIFTQGCKLRPERLGLGVDDIFQTWSDLYIVPSGTVASGGKLSDVNGAPNVVFGGLAGGFVDQVIGYSGPGEKRIPAGTYDIVLDECQDGFLDTEDTLIQDAFTVTIPLGTESAVIPGVNKFASTLRAEAAGGLAKAWKKLMESTKKKKVVGGLSMTVSMDLSIGIVQGMMGTSLPDPRDAAHAALLQLARAHAGLAADPPDPAFPQHATPVIPGAASSGSAISDPVYGDDFEALLVETARSAELDAAVIAALVSAIERHQGAAAVGNGDWMAQHAREALALLDVIDVRAESTPTLLDEVADRWAHNDLRPLRDAVNVEMTRARDYAAQGPHNRNTLRDGMNRGMTAEQVEAAMQEILEANDIDGLLRGNASALRDYLRDEAAAQRDAAAGFTALRADLEASIAGLATEQRDAPRPTPSINTPGNATTGEAVTLDASGSVDADGGTNLEYAWDLDLDGVFDDADSHVVSHVFAVSGERVVAVQVTDAEGATAVGYAVVTVTPANTAPRIAATVSPAVLEADPGASFTLEVTVSDPDGDAVEVEWMQEGVSLGVGGTSFTGTAQTEIGTSVRYDAVATDSHGAKSMQPFVVTVFGPDSDGDGWRQPVDCMDDNDLVHPARNEVPGNGLDDDCNPLTSDDPQAPRSISFSVDSDLTPTTGTQEGDLFVIRSTGWQHPQRNSGEEFTVSVDWGDGTVTEHTVSGTTSSDTRIAAEHVYTRNGSFDITMCITDPAGLTGCQTRYAYTGKVLPAPPVIHPADLRDWNIEESGRAGEHAVSGTGKWIVAPGGFSANQMNNINFPTVLLSDYALDTSAGPRRVSFDFGTSYTGDDDFIGFVLGLDPGEINRDDADWLAVRFDGHVESFTSNSCGGTPVHHSMDDPMSVIRYTGYGHWYEYTGATTLRVADATDPLCDDDMGAEVLASGKLPPDLGWITAGTYRRIAHASDIAANNSSLRDQLYHAEVEYSPESLRVWVDGQLMFDIDAPADSPFPQGHVGLFSQSQPATRLIGHEAVPAVAAVQGQSQTFTTSLANADPATSHTAVIDWGDGTPASEALIEPVDGRPGFWTVSAEHAYQRLGTFFANVCATDATDAQIGCGLIEVSVENAPPIVEAGLDSTTLSHAELSGAHFSDPGTLDTHTATVDWGDGSDPEPVQIDGRPGSGLLNASHDYAEAGTYTVTVCATDAPATIDAGAEDSVTSPRPVVDPAAAALTGCDTMTVTVLAALVEPVTLTTEDQSIVEGDTATIGVGYEHATAGADHVVTVDWGDGSDPERVHVQDGGTDGSGWAAHRFTDNGTYTVTVSTESTWTPPLPDADTQQERSTRTLTITVENAVPVVHAGPDRVSSSSFSFDDVLVTDAGVLDTHTATIDWGDGSDPESLTVTPLSGGGAALLAGSHDFADEDTYTVTITVIDDDNGTGVGSFNVTITSAAPTFSIEAPESLTGEEGAPVTVDATVSITSRSDTDPITPPDNEESTENPGGESPESEPSDNGSGEGESEGNTDNDAPGAAPLSPEHLSASIDWGDGTSPEPVILVGDDGTRTISASHTYADNGVYLATLRVCADPAEEYCVAEAVIITVSNAPPVISELDADVIDDQRRIVRVTSSYSDPGTADTHTGFLDWGDGTIETLALFDGDLIAEHQYLDDGEYMISLTVRDKDSDEANQGITVTVKAGTGNSGDPDGDDDSGGTTPGGNGEGGDGSGGQHGDDESGTGSGKRDGLPATGADHATTRTIAAGGIILLLLGLLALSIRYRRRHQAEQN